MSKFDVCGIGNAIVDILSFTEEAFLAEQGIAKGSMQLVDETRSAQLYEKLGQTTECSGGSVANSLAGLAGLGARTCFIGKVKGDQLGTIFTHDMRSVGVHFDMPPVTEGPATANCLVMVTPDAQRTMATFLGACGSVSEADIDPFLVERSAITYIEGYLWDAEHAKAAIRKAIAMARGVRKRVAFTLSDTFCVERHRADFLQLINEEIDILFANEAEIKALYQTDDFDAALAKLRGACPVAAITRSEKGSVVLTKDDVEEVPAASVPEVVDTTGAGDLYASGFLFGIVQEWDLPYCAVLGNRCAGKIIGQLGARSNEPLAQLVA
ncbi:MAG: adenosine kinase [Alphaproteobacteria bacterium]|nr:adenosine kinase [Alphaproteobacteria bacterium]